MLVLIMAISGRTIPDLFTAATSLLAGFTTATMREDTISMDEALPPRILAMLTSRMDLEVAITVVEVIGKGREIADCGGLHLKYFEVEELYATTPAELRRPYGAPPAIVPPLTACRLGGGLGAPLDLQNDFRVSLGRTTRILERQ
jgi:hypothetical protein